MKKLEMIKTFNFEFLVYKYRENPHEIKTERTINILFVIIFIFALLNYCFFFHISVVSLTRYISKNHDSHSTKEFSFLSLCW